MSAVLEAEPTRTRAGDVPRLLTGPVGRSHSLHAHLEHHGPLPSFARDRTALIDGVELSGLTGRGGAGFPTAVKLRAVAGGRRPVVVANGTEGEPASAKDQVLIVHNPHLVLDGALAAADAVGAREIVIAVGRRARTAHDRLAAALAERRDLGRRTVEIAVVPDRFVAGEETALVSWLNGDPAKPTFTPPRPFERGVRGRPTLVQNVETLANLALIARHGPAWFRRVGTADEPGSALVTVAGCVRRPGVVEIPLGMPLGELVEHCGGLSARPRAVLVGGYSGTWIAARAAAARPLSDAGLRSAGAGLGARAMVVLPESACGVAETARIVRYLARESAGQCGPCVFGLDAVATAFETIAARGRGAADARQRIGRYCAQIQGRGACAHPDGAVRLVRSALSVFADELDAHLAGRCTAASSTPILPVPR